MNIQKDLMSGRIRPASDVLIADKIMWLRKKGDMWATIAALVELWTLRFPEEQVANKIDVKEQKEDLRDSKFATTQDKHAERRLILILPLRLQRLIRSQFSTAECPFTRTFYQTFAKKFPQFMIPEKL